MSSRKGSLSSIERRLRRVAGRKGLTILKTEKPSAKSQVHGGYMLRDSTSFAVVFGNRSYDFSASLEEIEAFLEPDGEEE